jgi:predicted nucleic acid-binding protein
LPFVDASYIVALMDRRDRWHEAARRAHPRLVRVQPWRTHTMALCEVVAVIGSRAGGRAAREAYDAVRDTMDVWAPAVADLDAAMAHVVRFDGALTLSDALFVQAMAGEQDAAILSFDDDFDKAGVRRLPGR